MRTDEATLDRAPAPAASWTTRPHDPAPHPGALTAALDAAGELSWSVPGDARIGSIPVPPGLDPSLALLAPALAVAEMVRQQWLPAAGVPAAIEIDPYDTVGFLLHQLVAERHPATRVTAVVLDGIQATTAAAFGAEIREVGTSSRRPVRMPTAPQVRSALSLIESRQWRFAPGVTIALDEDEWGDAIATGTLGHGLEAVVHP